MKKQRKAASLAKMATVVLVITFISKVFGFARELIVASVLGAGAVTDAYNVMLTIPNFLLLIFQQVVSIAFIPIVTKIVNCAENKIAEQNSFVNKCILLIGGITFLVSLLAFIFSDFFVSIFAFGLDQETSSLASLMLRLGIWSMVIQGATIVFSAFLTYKKRFVFPALTGFCLDIACIVFVYLSGFTGAYYLLGLVPVGNVLLQLALLLPVSIKEGFRFTKITRPLFDKSTLEFLKVTLPALLSVGISQISILVNKNFASYLGEGSISALNYAQTIQNLVSSLIVSSISTVMYTEFSYLHANKRPDLLASSLLGTYKTVAFLVVPACLLLFIFAKEVVEVLYQRGAFDEKSTELTASALRSYSLGLPFVCFNDLFLKYLYAQENRKIPVLFSGISLLVTIGVNFLTFFFTDWGVGGIAISASIGGAFNTVILCFYICIKYRVPKLPFLSHFLAFLNVSTLSSVFAYLAFEIAAGVFPVKLVDLIAAGILFVLIYCLGTLFFDSDLRQMLNHLIAKLFKNKKRTRESD